MATPEIKEILPTDIVSDQTMAQIYVTDEVQKGLVIAPTLNMSSLPRPKIPPPRKSSPRSWKKPTATACATDGQP